MRLRNCSTLLLLLFLVVLNPLHADNEKYEVKFLLSPTFEKMNPRNRAARSSIAWKHKLSYNFGAEYKRYFAPDVSLSLGLLVQNKGFRTILDNFSSSDPRFNNSVFSLSVTYVSIPLNLNIHIESGKKSRILLIGGITNGYLIDARSRYKRVSEEDLATVNDPFSKSGAIDNTIIYKDVFNKWFLGINLGIGYTKYIKDKIAIEIAPIYTFQMNKGIAKTARVSGGQFTVNPKFDSIAIDLKVGYYFNKQIKNKSKQF